MKIPAKILYAYKAMVELALRSKERLPVQIHTISEAQHIPEKFLVQILIRLKNAGLVASSRGITGGYALVRDPALISLADIVRAVDDNIISDAVPLPGGDDSQRLLSALWFDVNTAIARKLEAANLEVIISKIRNQELTYSI